MSASETKSDDVFDVERIRRLVQLMEQHDLREIDLRKSEQRIRLCRGADDAVPTPRAAVPDPTTLPPVPATGAGRATEPAAAAADDHLTVITSPMVGTFYSRPNPNAEPYVKVGDVVEPETTICVIEAMKVFNEIPAETHGKIVAILVDDEEPIDFGRPLFKLDPRGV
jgi:acetyl-CoA carboxylase biotin carboxyl carrier protein